MKYAKRINLLDLCGNTLTAGFVVLFAFFTIIAVITYVMMRRMLKNQLVFEQKRIELTNAMAHDIKTPLFVIGGYAQSLKENINNEKKDYFAEKIISQTEEVNALVHKMLNLGKLDSYSMKLCKTDFDLYLLVSEICEKYILLPENKDIEITHAGSNTVNADRELIKSALENLIDNAIKYSVKDSEIKIEISDKKLSVSNITGDLLKADLKQIWEPYFRKDKNHRQDGNGLGLSIVKSILELHDAEYTAKLRSNNFSVSILFSE